MTDNEYVECCRDITAKIKQCISFMDQELNTGYFEEVQELANSIVDLCDQQAHYRKKWRSE